MEFFCLVDINVSFYREGWAGRRWGSAWLIDTVDLGWRVNWRNGRLPWWRRACNLLNWLWRSAIYTSFKMLTPIMSATLLWQRACRPLPQYPVVRLSSQSLTLAFPDPTIIFQYHISFSRCDFRALNPRFAFPTNKGSSIESM